MTSKDFVSGLAGIMGVEKTELATVDRALAKAGLREVARGRYRPDITLHEGLKIVLAWAGGRKLTEGADEIDRLKHFFVTQGDYRDPSHTTSEKDTPEFRKIYGTSEARLGGQSLFEVLAIATKAVGKGEFTPENYWINVQKNGPVELVHTEGFLKKRRLCLDYLGKLDWPQEGIEKPNVTYTISISGAVLKWIYDVTEGAV